VDRGLKKITTVFNPQLSKALMKEPNHSRLQRERGVSIVEMLIVVCMIGIVTAFAVMQIAGAQRAMRLSNSAREFTSWLEKARHDSIRRHATFPVNVGDPDLRASVTITAANSYTVTLDQNGDGSLDPPLTITIPATHGATFVGISVPLTIRYNWRGRPEDVNGNLLDLAFSLQDASGNINPINVASTGDMSLDSNVNTSTVSVSGVSSTSNIKAKTTVP
jgi:Tfp pilus assembly protein FimT